MRGPILTAAGSTPTFPTESMKLIPKNLRKILLASLLAAVATAQTASAPAKPPSNAVIDGTVVKDAGSEPVKKAVIELIGEIAPGEAGGNYTAVTAADGRFHIEGILPGRYLLFVERTGFLEASAHHTRGEGRVLTLTAGQELKDLEIRLQAAAVVQGRVVDEDGDPLPNTQVTVLRQSFASGHGRWEQVGGERTNDLGEYRIASLPSGNYYVSATPPPDFKSLIEAAGGAKPGSNATANDGGPNDKQATSYQTTYYPGTTDRGQATPIQLHPGDEFPVNFALTLSPALSIRGAVVGLPPHTSASILLQSHDFNLMFSGAEVQKDGSFVIHDVSPGAYTILATVDNAPTPMMTRQSLQIANNVEGLRLTPQPGAWIRGRLRLESKSNSTCPVSQNLDPGQIFFQLRPADRDDDFGTGTLAWDTFSNLTNVAADGSFEWKSVPQGNYYVKLAGEHAGAGSCTGDWYLKSALAGGRDVNESGISVNGGMIVLDLVASANGGVIEGIAVNQKNEPVANAVIVSAPSTSANEARLRGREDRYGRAVSDQAGHFTLRGIPPGDYTLFAWETLDGEAYLNPDFMKNYEGQGSALRMAEGERKSVQLTVIPDSTDSQ
jgi:protocatechuate 3,4-dioxygenase beta subunit